MTQVHYLNLADYLLIAKAVLAIPAHELALSTSLLARSDQFPNMSPGMLVTPQLCWPGRHESPK